MLPPVVILLITYKRLEVARETIRGIKARIKYPPELITWHIADDGSGGDHIKELVAEINGRVSHTDTGGHSVGKSMNLGISELLKRADIWLHWEDDWMPKMDIDLIPCVRLLQENEQIGMIRMGRLEAGLHGETIIGGDRIWWKLDKSKHEWCFTGHAAIRHRRFHDAYGSYREGITPGRTELGMLHEFNTRSGPDVVWPAWLPYDICDHIGDGYSFKEAMENRGLTKEQAAKEFQNKFDSLKVPA